MKEQQKDLEYWRKNAEEDYKKVPISVIRYISELEIAVSQVNKNDSLLCVSEIDLLMEFDVWISARFGQEYKIEESRDIMQKFLNSR